MPCMGPSTEVDSDSEPFVEVDPTGRYGRYSDLLGAGAVKRVYRAFDQEDGIEVAWNQVRLRGLRGNEEMLDRLFSEIRLLRSLRHSNIITLYKVWSSDDHGGTINFITEVCTSGNLREYRMKHRHVSLKALKKWSLQILLGLEYLHNHEPCIIHRDLNCSNVFVNGNLGQVKIGDLGMAAIVERDHVAHSLLGTPEFMAPELYEEEYTEQVDIYAFGLCVLELVTLELPYSECDSVAKIYRKVSAGIRPAALGKVRDSEVKAFIERCLGKPRARPSATELLKDPFFFGLDDVPPELSPPPTPDSANPESLSLSCSEESSPDIASLSLQ
ncbi:probable serine/threonine-protein kinase WNK11 [Dioscorea cayenensis subsp. rotundata]|uniref:non-specific serine/threonine protein kinase n=1 Tax=Dioscorea cayennensis subsp. rotundata TaxID=55577 RepID=A0AB40D703_DIOCR|nr:probable serine/threonine-protein kinase WNK11 [Dioscorea cayenensis subsp. rotundata]XP_039146067.1 probable serine/threonine-protein kinase WNK11 [Dioscorea cayenensis subsp. rotundata]XP_039146068.1 probable serine/threonine-protein kinase WNK11 [Dioscorea cayenensis subsp. rotundata]XP_039146069.1 probable serine/threonine-protein kinase WNK11 [Dioscorea cayenensis subsp. rotundata]